MIGEEKRAITREELCKRFPSPESGCPGAALVMYALGMERWDESDLRACYFPGLDEISWAIGELNPCIGGKAVDYAERIVRCYNGRDSSTFDRTWQLVDAALSHEG